MTAVEFDRLHQHNAQRLVRLRASRRGVDVPQARADVASELRVSAAKIERAEKGRFKQVSAFFYERMRALVIREIEKEIGKLSHELDIARQAGVGATDPAYQEAAAALAMAKNLMRGGA